MESEAHKEINIVATDGKDVNIDQHNVGTDAVSVLTVALKESSESISSQLTPTDASIASIHLDDCTQDNNCINKREDSSTDYSAERIEEINSVGKETAEESVARVREDEAPDRDGSDSGLGSDTTFAVPPTDDDSDDDKFLSELISFGPRAPKPSAEPGPGNLKRKAIGEVDQTAKRLRKSISFNNVTVYYFPRTQGFTCVPSQGGSTLGMERRHSHVHTFTLHEHALEQRRLHRQLLQQLRSERLHRLTPSAADLSSDDSDDDEEEEASDTSESELDLDGYYFLQPVPTRQRRALLRAAGVGKVDPHEKDECRDIRLSRELCGCACKGACEPDSCTCSVAGIKCQVDRVNFPCGCTHDTCANTAGRIEFNPVRVQTHFIRTLVRLGLERTEEHSRRAAEQSWNSTTAGAYSDLHLPAPTPSVRPEYASSHLTEMAGGAQVDVYASASNRAKGPSYDADGLPYDPSRPFPCNLGSYQYSDGRFEGFHSYSATSFEEFAHPAHVSMFNNYGHVYVPEYIPKPEPHYSSVPLAYESAERCQYPTSSEIYQNKEREESAVGGDENWFSGETSAGAEVTVTDPAPAAPTSSEDFGEIIKKTMVESVIG